MDASKFTPKFEVPEEMRDFAEKSVDQARKAFDGFIGAAQKAMDSWEGSTATARFGSQDLTRKTLGYAEQNMHAALDHAQRLVRTKDMQEALKLQADFVQAQFVALQEQAKELGATIQKGASEAASKAKSSI
ncbi:phasin [Chelatococcus reniformis]|uniref:Phasin n=1 Tax=Chelatococcus reniformis TaxID=1494448 RepID=A0A916URY0_9HYPH|nr:phasin [Chelatococcus reniformis]GGC83783.1 phasin [Chelatococcus reniformis]